MKRTAIVGGTVIDGSGNAPIEHGLVLVEDGRIVNVCRQGDAAVPDDAVVVDAGGMWITPGLIDAHTHAATLADNSWMNVDDPLALTDRFMTLAVQHGVTTIRDTGDFDPGPVLRLMKAGRPGWPRFYGAGPVLNGPGARHHWFEVLETEAQARSVVARLAAQGVDFLKVHVWMQPIVMQALIHAAHGVGLRVTGHLGRVVTVEQAVRMGIDSLEHIRIGPELLTVEGLEQLARLPERERDYSMSCKAWRFIDPTSEASRRLIDLMVERQVFLTPTLHFHREIQFGDVPEVANPPELALMPTEAVATWKSHRFYDDYTVEDFKWAKVEYARQIEFLQQAHEAGVPITAGTDVSVLPGTSLHEELGLLVDAGLTPMDALLGATRLAADQLGQAEDLGVVAKRARADLLVLSADPLADIANTRSIRYVILDGDVAFHSPPATVAQAD